MKFIVPSLTVLLLCFPLYCSTYQAISSQQYGTHTSNETIKSVYSTDNQNYIGGKFTGSTNFGDKNLTSDSNYAAFVVIYDKYNVQAKSFSFGGDNTPGTIDCVNSIYQSYQDIMFVGSFQGSIVLDNTTFLSNGSSDIFIVLWIDLHGDGSEYTYIFSKTFGGPGEDVATDVTWLSSNGYVITCGYFEGNVSFGGTTLYGGNRSWFISKHSANQGAHVWSISLPAGGEALAIATNDGYDRIYVAGYQIDPLTLGGVQIPAGPNGLIIQLDADGNVMNFNFFGGTNGGPNKFLDVLTAGQFIYAVGTAYGSVDFGSGSVTASGDSNGILVSYFTNLTLSSGYIYGNTGTDSIESIASGAGHIFLLGSYSNSFSLGGSALPIPPAGKTGLFVAEVDSNGVPQWSIGATTTSQIEGACITANNLVYPSVTMWGSFDGVLTSNDTVLASSDTNGFSIEYGQLIPTLQYLLQVNTTSELFAQATALDSQMNVLVGGYFKGTTNFGGSEIVSSSGYSGFLSKYNPPLQHTWSLVFYGGDTSVSAIAVDSMDGIVVVGSFQTSLNLTGLVYDSQGDKDGFVASYASNGSYLWSFHFGNTSTDKANDVAVGNDDSIFVCGSISGISTLSGQTIGEEGVQSWFLAKYTPSGDHLWSQYYGCNGEASSIAVDFTNNLVAVGTCSSSVTINGTSYSTSAITSMYLDSTGLFRWLTGWNAFTPASVAFDSTGSFYVTLGCIHPVTDGSQLCIEKHQSNGDFVWSWAAGSYESFYDVTVGKDDIVLATGFVQGNIIEGVITYGSGAIVIAFASNGTYLWHTAPHLSGYTMTGQAIAASKTTYDTFVAAPYQASSGELGSFVLNLDYPTPSPSSTPSATPSRSPSVVPSASTSTVASKGKSASTNDEIGIIVGCTVGGAALIGISIAGFVLVKKGYLLKRHSTTYDVDL